MPPLVSVAQPAEWLVVLAIAAIPFAAVCALIWFGVRAFDKSAQTPAARRPGSLRIRPFGLAGSIVEVFIGASLMRSVLWTDEGYSQPFTTLVAGAGAIVLLIGLFGVSVYLHARLRRPV